MGIQVKLKFEDGVRIAEGMWRAEVEPAQLAVLGTSAAAERGPSIVFLDAAPTETADGGVEFALDGARLMNLGTQPEAIVISVSASESTIESAGPELADYLAAFRVPSGDRAFLDSLPRNLRDLGEEFLKEMRREFPGELQYRAVSGRWIDAPDPWWTIKPQPYRGNFYISVRRPPEDYDVPTSIVMKRERASWSRFYVGALNELKDAMSVMRQASRHRK